jgi:hypothetical protein
MATELVVSAGRSSAAGSVALQKLNYAGLLGLAPHTAQVNPFEHLLKDARSAGCLSCTILKKRLDLSPMFFITIPSPNPGQECRGFGTRTAR